MTGADDVYTIDNDGPNENNATKNNSDPNDADYFIMQGTSMACPHAAGIGALILEKNPTWTPAQVRHALESTAAPKGAPGWDSVYGWGLIDALAAVNSSLPTWASYSSYTDPENNIPCDEFVSYTDEHTVYMRGSGFTPGTYKVVYWDPTEKRVAEVTTADNTLESQWTLNPSQATEGNWHVAVYTQYADPQSYSATDSYLVADDTSYTGDYAFYVAESAIPEFPTALAAIVAMALSAGIYLWMRRKAAPARLRVKTG